ncbi:MAG: radical SAM protein [Pseudomonadota bacterium]
MSANQAQSPCHNASDLYEEGLKYYQAGCLGEAIRLWLQFLEIMPDSPIAIVNLGAAYKDLGDLKQAEVYFLRALAIQPDFLEANFNLAVTCHLQGNFKAALAHYLQAIRVKPDYADAHTNLDVLLYENVQDPNLALACFQKIRDVNPAIDEVGPRRIRIETSSACNLRCQHCPTGTNYNGAERNIMSMEMYDDILRQMKAMPILKEVIFYLGGEPLLNKNLSVMCRRVKEETKVTLTQFNTNGMLVTEELCRQLAGAMVNKILVSIDGISPEENDEIRRGSHYAEIVKKHSYVDPVSAPDPGRDCQHHHKTAWRS